MLNRLQGALLIEMFNVISEGIMTPEDVAATLKVSPETVRRLCTEGKIAWLNAGTGSSRVTRRIKRSALDDFLHQEQRASVQAEMQSIRHASSAAASVEERW